jgi:hypothetical protein
MAKRHIETIREELERARESADVTITVSIHGQRTKWSEELTDEENREIDGIIYSAIDEASDLIYERLDEILDLDLDEDYDPDEGLEDDEVDEVDEVDKASQLTEKRERLLKELAQVDAQIEDLNSTLIA